MAGRSIEIGDVGQQVATAVAELRRRRGWDQKRLAELVTEAGRPMSASIVGKIECGARRVDVDDLVALAFALEVSPARLLLSANRDPEDVPATAASAEDSGAPGRVTARVLDDVAALGDLEALDATAPTLAAVAVRLAQEIDTPGAFALHSLSKELRAVMADLRSLAPEEPDDDDDLDLATPD